MDRHRCSKCRNPIRNLAVSRAGAGDDDAWFHLDCWDQLCASEQENYERRVSSEGLAALLAPYVFPAYARAAAG